MAHISLDDLLALGAGGSAGVVCLEGRRIGVLGDGNTVEVDEDTEEFLESVKARLAPAEAAPAKPAKAPKPAKAKSAPVESLELPFEE